MSKPNYMEKLLEGVEVEWKTFGEVAKIQRGASPRPIAKFITDKEDGVPWIKIGDTSPNSKYVNKTEQRVTPEGAMKSRILKKGDFIMSNSMSFGRPYILNIDGAIHDGWASISDFGDKLISDYLYHYLSSDLVQSYWISKINSGSVSNLNSDIIKSLEIPIPPLKVQAEIVRILDAFTELTAELTAELTVELTDRKKQCEYYRDKLLTFEEGEVEWKTLGDVTKLITKGTTPKVFTVSGINFVKLESFNNSKIDPSKFVFITKETHVKELKRSTLEENDILFAIAGATIGKCAVVEKSILPANTNQALAIVRLGESVNVKFVFYYMQTNTMKEYIAKYNKASAQPNLNLQQISDFKIPIPTLEEQTRIVSILDKFAALTSSITEGLSREIELRQKQYEYYRNMLLSFPKSEVEV
ncbi:type I restriction enzyme S subunit [Paenibacillus castaneae]|uniref:restriction endonuclease subunit S n=1 Tax=Paenibacillus castaneae TaxID=474957 RepID=UPI000C9B39E3|nr:restriction endonuclease subunit S [Paenibacillus castaneae]NIK77949.1 type I restriction enzyme S subunit [Paenibacillus castaneae]